MSLRIYSLVIKNSKKKTEENQKLIIVEKTHTFQKMTILRNKNSLKPTIFR